MDANLIFKVVTEPTELVVQRLWNGWDQTRTVIVAPRLLYYEVTNVLHQYAKHGRMTQELVEASLQIILALPLEIHDSTALHAEALRFARRFALPAAYDAHYLALADSLGVPFWTTDQRLARSVRPTLNWVHVAGEAISS